MRYLGLIVKTVCIVTLLLFTVTFAYAGSIVLSWDPPTTNEDGTPLPITGITGYKIYCGTSSKNYATPITVTGGAITTFTLTNKPAGTYYCAATAFKTIGTTVLESKYSNEVSKVVLEVPPSPPTNCR